MKYRSSVSNISKTKKKYEIEIITNFKKFSELQNEWNELAPPGNVEPWQEFSWNMSAAMAYSERRALRVITIRKNRKLTSIAPMILHATKQTLHPWQLHFLGGEELKEPNRLIASDFESLELLTDVIASERIYPIRLSRLVNDNGAGEMLLSKLKKNGWIVKSKCMPYPYIDLKESPLKKSLLKDIKRAESKAEKLGNIHFEVIDKSCKNIQEYISKGFQIEASGWKGRNGTSILANKWRTLFFRNYAQYLNNDERLILSFFMINGKPIAVQYAIRALNQYWLLNIGYEEKFKECSPGNILLKNSIEYSVNKGFVRYNLLGKEEEWTKRWTEETKDTLIISAYKLNTYGIKSILSDALYLTKRKQRTTKK